MAPKQPSLDLLFHPKKNKKPQHQPPRKTPSTPRPKPAPEENEGLQLPDWPFQDFRLLSSALNGWKYDVMKFDSRRTQDVSRWIAPVKLNRKDLRKDEPATEIVPQAPMLGPDGKPVIGADGNVVMVDAEGIPIQPAEGKEKGKSAANSAAVAKKRFQKKTRQVFYVPEEVRLLRKEERYPWIMEDSNPVQDNRELWVGQLEDVGKAETHAFFMPAANDVFKFVPAHRWYKFQKKLRHGFPTDTAGVEQLYTTSQKRDPQAWLASRNGGRGVSAATAAMFKAEAEGRTITIGNSLVHTTGQSLGPGGRRLKTVDSGMDHLFGEDEDEDEDGEFKKRRAREMGGEGDMDEQVYEEDFADDDEHALPDENDEEVKEAEERLKRAYRTANKHREAGIDEDEDQPEDPRMSKQARAMQKLIRNREGNDAYESDDDNRNPYASSEEEEEEEVSVPTGPAIQQQPQQVDVQARSQTPKPGDTPNLQSDVNSSQATSPSLGGHSMVAKRATSPKAPKLLNQGVSKPSSPNNSRATSPTVGSRATSPAVNGQNFASNKRKADDTVNAGSHNVNGQPKAKRRKEVAPVTPEEMKALLAEWLKTSPKEKATTRECIQHFTPYLTDQGKKAEFSKMVREIAVLKEGHLVLRASVVSVAPSTTE